MSDNSASSLHDFLDDEKFIDVVKLIWAEVFKVSNKIIKDAGIFGFPLLEQASDPNIHQMLTGLKLIDKLLESLSDMCDSIELEYDAKRDILNSRQQILNIESVANALKAKNHEDYESAMGRLKSQAVF